MTAAMAAAAESPASGASPLTERKSAASAAASITPSSPLPTNSGNGQWEIPGNNSREAAAAAAVVSSSSTQSSPARYKINNSSRQNKKLVATRSSPQLMLNQIHEEEVSFNFKGCPRTESVVNT